MTNAALRLREGRFGRSASGLVYGDISLQVGDRFFPDEEWNDSVVLVLTWWCRALLRILDGDRGAVTVRFMEGPYLAELSSEDGILLHVALVEGGSKTRVCQDADVDILPLIESVLSASDRILKECAACHWLSADVDELIRSESELRRRPRSGGAP